MFSVVLLISNVVNVQCAVGSLTWCTCLMLRSWAWVLSMFDVVLFILHVVHVLFVVTNRRCCKCLMLC